MNKSAFIHFGIFVVTFRCLMAFSAIVPIVLATTLKNRLISPIREWLSDVIFYSIFASLLVLSVSVVELLNYTEKNLDQFKKNVHSRQNLKLKSYMMVTAVEVVVLICYCANIQYTMQIISIEVKHILHTGLNKYSTNSAWQVFWDEFQQHYYCCGNSQSTDWFQIAWKSPIIIQTFSLLRKYTQENRKFIIPAAPITCCLPDTICDTFDYEQPDPKMYNQKGCFSVIAETINSIASSRYFFYAVVIIQIFSAVVKFEGYTDNNYNQKSKF